MADAPFPCDAPVAVACTGLFSSPSELCVATVRDRALELWAVDTTKPGTATTLGPVARSRLALPVPVRTAVALPWATGAPADGTDALWLLDENMAWTVQWYGTFFIYYFCFPLLF